MSLFGWGVGDIITISILATKVVTAYKGAPDDYRYISDEVNSLKCMIDDAREYYEGTTLSDKKRKAGQVVLKGCEGVLADLNSLVGKYKSLDSTDNCLDWNRIKFSNEDIATLRQRLISNTGFLSHFVRRSNIPVIPVQRSDTNISTLVVNMKKP